MPLTTITAPLAHPVTVEDCKSFARVDYDDEDDLFESLIGAATDHVIQATGRALVQTSYMLTLRDFPREGDGIIALPRSPLIEVSSVQYLDKDGDLQTLVADTDFLAGFDSEPGTIEPVQNWPATADGPDAVQITFIAGYEPVGSPPDHAANVPSRAKVAVKSLVAWWFDERVPVPDTPRIREAPYHVTRLINGLKIWNVS